MILVISDSEAALLTLGVLIEINRNHLSIEQINVVNAIIGFQMHFNLLRPQWLQEHLYLTGSIKRQAAFNPFQVILQWLCPQCSLV